MAAAQSTSSRALLYFSERVEDATEAVKGLLGASSNGAQAYDDTSDDLIRAQLESDRDEVRLEGLKTVVSLISKGREASAYFASVVKLSSNVNLEIRKLVYIIVRRYARRQPDIALLGINSFQRDLQDRNEVVRAMALRVLTGLRLKLAASVVDLAIARCVRDPHFHVRRSAALAMIKSLDVSLDIRETFTKHVQTLLRDRNPVVLGAALAAWSVICPDAVEMLHPHYRKICYALGDMDPWSQCEAISVLGLYAKRCVPRQDAKSSGKMDRDMDLLLVKVEDLLCSPNAAVVCTASRLLLTLAPQDRHIAVTRPLFRLLSVGDQQIAYITLLNCLYITTVSPHILSSHLYDFLPRSSLHESAFCTRLKLQIMTRIAKADTTDIVISELMEQARLHPNETLSAFAVEQAGLLVARCTDRRKRIAYVRQLIQLAKECRSKDVVVGRTLNVIRIIVEGSEAGDASAIVVRLAPLLFGISPSSSSSSTKDAKRKTKASISKSAVQSAVARASIFWLLGQYCRLLVNTKQEHSEVQKTIAEIVCLDVLRRAALTFAKEQPYVKLQIITLSTKLITVFPTIDGVDPARLRALAFLHSYILQLARYDEQFDVRDRARFCKALTDRLEVGLQKEPAASSDDVDIKDDDYVDEQLGGVVLRRQQALHILFEGKLLVLDKDRQTKEIQDWNVLDDAVGQRPSRMLASRLPDFFAEPWAEVSSLPPINVRDAEAQDTHTPVIASSSSGMDGRSSSAEAATQASDSSYDVNVSKVNKVVASVTGDLDTRPSASPLLSSDVRAPFQQAAGAKVKYRDLDDFLDAEEESDDDVHEMRLGGAIDSEVDEVAEEVEEEADEDEDEAETESESSSEESDTDSDESRSAGTQKTALHAQAPLSSLPAEENAWA